MALFESRDLGQTMRCAFRRQIAAVAQSRKLFLPQGCSQFEFGTLLFRLGNLRSATVRAEIPSRCARRPVAATPDQKLCRRSLTLVNSASSCCSRWPEVMACFSASRFSPSRRSSREVRSLISRPSVRTRISSLPKCAVPVQSACATHRAVRASWKAGLRHAACRR